MKDLKLVIFYTNDLARIPSEEILVGTSEEVILCVHGLGPYYCWVGNNVLFGRMFQVSAPNVANKMFMKTADIMDQQMSTNIEQQ